MNNNLYHHQLFRRFFQSFEPYLKPSPKNDKSFLFYKKKNKKKAETFEFFRFSEQMHPIEMFLRMSKSEIYKFFFKVCF